MDAKGDTPRFFNVRVVVTGAGGGIGSAVAERFLKEGARVLAADLAPEGLAALTARCEAGDRLQTACFDVSEEEACFAFARQADADWRGLDVLVNNAGWFPICAFEDMTLAQWRRVCAVNLDSVFLMTRAFLPLLKTSARGRIVNVGSGSVFRGPADQAHYVAAKAGVVGFTRSLANAVGGYGITANVVTPGLTATPGALQVFAPEAIADRARARPIKRVQTGEDVVGAVTFLASRDADFITGQIINVDGGVTMR